ESRDHDDTPERGAESWCGVGAGGGCSFAAACGGGRARCRRTVAPAPQRLVAARARERHWGVARCEMAVKGASRRRTLRRRRAKGPAPLILRAFPRRVGCEAADRRAPIRSRICRLSAFGRRR